MKKILPLSILAIILGLLAVACSPDEQTPTPEIVKETVVVKDLIKGDVTFSSENIGGDFIIVRSDGTPIYNYIVTIDDSLMKVTHVIRGEDHLSNTPKQILLC